MAVTDLIPRLRTTRKPAATQNARANPLVAFHEEVDRLFEDFWSQFEEVGSTPAISNSWPRLDVMETDKAVEIHAELPGLDESDVEVLLQDEVLILRGEKRGEAHDSHRRVRERFYGRFERQIALPAEVERDKVCAAFRQGVLTVTLPKSATAVDRVRRIPITTR